MLESLCPPALIYIMFSLIQIIVDVTNGLYNTALLKFWVSGLFTILLNYLCVRGLGVISWFIVFIPFILMTLIITLLLLVLGLNPSTGKLNFPKEPRPLPPKPIDYRQMETKKRNTGFYDNYNDSNANTIVTNDTQNTTSTNTTSNASYSTTSGIINNAEKSVQNATTTIGNDISNIGTTTKNDINSGLNDIKNLF